MNNFFEIISSSLFCSPYKALINLWKDRKALYYSPLLLPMHFFEIVDSIFPIFIHLFIYKSLLKFFIIWYFYLFTIPTIDVWIIVVIEYIILSLIYTARFITHKLFSTRRPTFFFNETLRRAAAWANSLLTMTAVITLIDVCIQPLSIINLYLHKAAYFYTLQIATFSPITLYSLILINVITPYLTHCFYSYLLPYLYPKDLSSKENAAPFNVYALYSKIIFIKDILFANAYLLMIVHSLYYTLATHIAVIILYPLFEKKCPIIIQYTIESQRLFLIVITPVIIFSFLVSSSLASIIVTVTICSYIGLYDIMTKFFGLSILSPLIQTQKTILDKAEIDPITRTYIEIQNIRLITIKKYDPEALIPATKEHYKIFKQNSNHLTKSTIIPLSSYQYLKALIHPSNASESQLIDNISTLYSVIKNASGGLSSAESFKYFDNIVFKSYLERFDPKLQSEFSQQFFLIQFNESYKFKSKSIKSIVFHHLIKTYKQPLFTLLLCLKRYNKKLTRDITDITATIEQFFMHQYVFLQIKPSNEENPRIAGKIANKVTRCYFGKEDGNVFRRTKPLLQ